MTALRPEQYRERREKAPPFEIRVVSYRLGERWHCKIDNVDPGANIARAEGGTREQAEEAALAKAKDSLSRTRVFPA